MADEATGAAPTLPTPDPVPLPAPPASTEPTTSETVPGGPSTTPTPDPRAWLDTADAKEIIGHKRVAGILGERLQAERSRIDAEAYERAWRDLNTQHQREESARRLQEQDETLLRDLEEQPLDAAERVRQGILERRRQDELDKIVQQRLTQHEPLVRQQLVAETNEAIAAWAAKRLPAAVIVKFRDKQYEGTYVQQAQAWLDDAWTELSRLERASWEREATPALEKEALTRLNGGEPVPDTDAGRPTTGELTLERWQAMSSEERRKLPSVQVDQMTRRVMRGAV